MEDEKTWLERFGYAAGDDRVMAYKLVKLGYRACVVSNALYQHQDAKTSTSIQEMKNTTPIFCMYYMHVVFWHRFVLETENCLLNRFLNRVCFGYWYIMITFYQFMKGVNPDYASYLKAFREGLKEGKQYVKTEEYRNLPYIE